MALADQIIAAESGGNPNATNPRSSASGSGQFTAGTWIETIQRHRPDLAQGKSPQDILALRADPGLSRDMTDARATDNAAVLQRAGLPVSPGTLYLAHFAGPQGAVSLLSADPSAPAGDVLGPAAVKANPFLRNMTVGQVRSWASGKVGGDNGQGAAQQAAQPQHQPAQAAAAPPFALGGGGGSPAAPSAQDGTSEAVDAELQQRIANIPDMLAKLTAEQTPQPQQQLNMPTPPAQQAAQMSGPQMQLRQRLMQMMMNPQPQQPQQGQT